MTGLLRRDHRGCTPGGSYSSYQADLIVRMPKTELQAVLIKQQHNGKNYSLTLPRIMHEYVILWRKAAHGHVARPRSDFVPA